MAQISKLGQYHGDITVFNQTGQTYPISQFQYISLRMIPALFSSMCSVFFYISLRNMKISPIPSFCSCLLISFDQSMIVESKFILSDGVLHFFSILNVLALSYLLKTDNELCAILTGITLGLAGSCKMTALGLFAVAGISQIVWIFVKRPDIFSIIVRASFLLGPAILIISLSYVWHFSIGKFTGTKSGHISSIDKPSLIDPVKQNYTYWGNRIRTSSLLMRIVRWNKVMNQINMHSKIPHPYESLPSQWPFLTGRYVLFFSETNRKIACLGGVASHLISTAFIFASPLFYLYFRRIPWQSLLMLWGWVVSYVPFFAVPRTMFHYHYIVPLMFAIANVAVLLDMLPKKQKGFSSAIIAFCAIVAYIYFYPLIYGKLCPSCDKTRVLRRWFEGPPKPLIFYGEKALNTTKLYGELPQ